MKMKENLIEIYKVLINDEELLRLLYYKPSNYSDDPLDDSKEDILSKSDKWDIIKNRVKRSIVTNDLDSNVDKLCRILIYPDRRYNTNNYFIADQAINVDIWTHHEYDEVDFRLSWLCDRVNELIFNKRITGIGKVSFRGGMHLGEIKGGYVGYQMTFELGSGK